MFFNQACAEQPDTGKCFYLGTLSLLTEEWERTADLISRMEGRILHGKATQEEESLYWTLQRIRWSEKEIHNDIYRASCFCPSYLR